MPELFRKLLGWVKGSWTLYYGQFKRGNHLLYYCILKIVVETSWDFQLSHPKFQDVIKRLTFYQPSEKKITQMSFFAAGHELFNNWCNFDRHIPFSQVTKKSTFLRWSKHEDHLALCFVLFLCIDGMFVLLRRILFNGIVTCVCVCVCCFLFNMCRFCNGCFIVDVLSLFLFLITPSNPVI